MAALYLTAMGAFVLVVLGLWDTLLVLTRRAPWEEPHHAVARRHEHRVEVVA